MDIIEQMNEALLYIEEHLDNEIDFNKIFRLAGCSEYHFRRIFPYLTGMSLGEYIRKRKLSLAGVLLRNGKNKVIDIAIQFGYESPDSFAKAFSSFHGITPSEARNHDLPLKVCLPFVFQLTIKGGKEMNYRIVEKEAFKIIGVFGKIPLIYNGPNDYTADVWRKLKQEDILVLLGYSKIEPSGMLSIYTNYSEKRDEGSELDLYVGVAVDAKFDPFIKKFNFLEVAASTWAVFTSIGKHPDSAQATWANISSEWLWTSGYEHTGGPELLWYETYEFARPDFKTEIWIPIKKRVKK